MSITFYKIVNLICFPAVFTFRSFLTIKRMRSWEQL